MKLLGKENTTRPDPVARKADGFTYPRVSPEALPYWEGCLQNELRYQRCGDCSEPVFHPRAVCPYCLSDNLSWECSEGVGEIYSFSVQYVALYPEREGNLPRAVGIVALKEGYHMFTELEIPVGSELRVGQKVRVYFDRVADDLALPKFRID